MTRSSSGLPTSRLMRVSVTPLTVLTTSWTCLGQGLGHGEVVAADLDLEPLLAAAAAHAEHHLAAARPGPDDRARDVGKLLAEVDGDLLGRPRALVPRHELEGHVARVRAAAPAAAAKAVLAADDLGHGLLDDLRGRGERLAHDLEPGPDLHLERDPDLVLVRRGHELVADEADEEQAADEQRRDAAQDEDAVVQGLMEEPLVPILKLAESVEEERWPAAPRAFWCSGRPA